MAEKKTIQNAIPSDAGLQSFDRIKSALASKYLQNDISLGSGVGGRVELIGDTVTEAFLNYLKNSIPDVRYLGPSTKPSIDPAETLKNVNNLQKAIENFGPQYKDLAKTYMDSLNSWMSSSRGMRNALNSPYAGGDKTLAEHLQNLVQNTDYRSPIPLFRGSSMSEIPNLQTGQSFENPFMSFTSSRQAAMDFNPRNVMMLESGARTLPVMGVSNYPGELEHVVGGKFGIQDIINNAAQRIIKIRQLNQ